MTALKLYTDAAPRFIHHIFPIHHTIIEQNEAYGDHYGNTYCDDGSNHDVFSIYLFTSFTGSRNREPSIPLAFREKTGLVPSSAI